MEYSIVKIFHKRTDLHAWFMTNVSPTEPRFGSNMEYSAQAANLERRYNQERDVRLILLVRYERNPLTNRMRTICKIHCPVNPLPVKGEFEAPSLNAVVNFLENNGWRETESLCNNLLK